MKRYSYLHAKIFLLTCKEAVLAPELPVIPPHATPTLTLPHYSKVVSTKPATLTMKYVKRYSSFHFSHSCWSPAHSPHTACSGPSSCSPWRTCTACRPAPSNGCNHWNPSDHHGGSHQTWKKTCPSWNTRKSNLDVALPSWYPAYTPTQIMAALFKVVILLDFFNNYHFT